jgi:hypothetical protein
MVEDNVLVGVRKLFDTLLGGIVTEKVTNATHSRSAATLRVPKTVASMLSIVSLSAINFMTAKKYSNDESRHSNRAILVFIAE